MSQITIGGTTLSFKDSSFTGDQWEQVASWVLNGGAQSIAENAQIAAEKAELSKSYAVGGTETRDGEDVDNAQYYKTQAALSAQEAQSAAEAMQECAPYDATKNYAVGNMATSAGSTYRCIKPCIGVSPPNDTYWLIIAKKGVDGTGAGDMTKETYDPNGKEQDIFAYADASSGAVQTNLTEHAENSIIHVTAAEKNAWNAKVDVDDIPTQLSDLSGDATHRVVSDAEKNTWNNKADKSTIVDVTLLAANWAGTEAPYTYTAAVAGVTTTSTQDWANSTSITEEQLTAWQAANIVDGGQGVGSVTFKAFGAKPTVDIPLRCILRRDT